MGQLFTIDLKPNGQTLAWSASANYNLALDLIPFTLTELIIEVNLNVTTSSLPGAYNDGWDRVFSTMSLNRGGITYMGFLDVPTAHHAMRYHLGSACPGRPAAQGSSQAAQTVKYYYKWHFGTSPWKVNPVNNRIYYDPFDLTAGVPKSDKADLTLQGTFAAANCIGSGYTINSGTITPYFRGVTNLPGQSVLAAAPLAFPAWEQKDVSSDLASATSNFATSEDFPIGDYLYATLLALKSGTNAARDNAALNNLAIWDSAGNRQIWVANDWDTVEEVTQGAVIGAPPMDDGTTLNQPSIAHSTDKGLGWFSFREIASAPDTDLGLILTGVQKSILQWRFGVGTVTTGKMYIHNMKYVRNAARPSQIVPTLHPEAQKNLVAGVQSGLQPQPQQ